jgi:hypothetical protein
MVANQVQIRRDSATNLNASTPASGELGWDTTNKRLRGGDGSTAGGIIIPSRIDLQNQAMVAIDAGGTANALTLTFTTGLIPSAYVKYQRFVFKATATNTTTATLNVNGLGAKTLKKMSTAGTTALTGGEIYNGQTYACVYDGTDILLESVPVAAATGAMVFLGSATASTSATLDFTSLITSSYDYYIFYFKDLKPATDDVDFWVRTSTNNGSSYDSGVTNYNTSRMVASNTGSPSASASGQSSSFVLTTDGVGNAAAEGISGEFCLFSPLGGVLNKGMSFKVTYQNNTTTQLVGYGMGFRDAVADIDAVRFMFASGNITSGTIYMYGVKNS